MITPEEFRIRWGQKDFVHYPADIVQSLSVPESARQFLLQAGLPRQAEDWFMFDVAHDAIPTLPEYLPSCNLPPDYVHYRLIGHRQQEWSSGIHITHYICLDEKADGQVVWVLNDDDSAYPASFLNSSLLHFAEMLLIYHEYRQWVYSTSWETVDSSGERSRCIRKAIAALREIDPETFQDQYETLWFWLVVDMKDECSLTAEELDLLKENKNRTVLLPSAFPSLDDDLDDFDMSNPFDDLDASDSFADEDE